MAYRPEVEVTLTSAEDLKNINWRHGPLSPYAVVWVDPDRKVSTRVDDEGDTSPTWNERLILSINRPIDDETTLNIDIVHANAAEDVKPLIGSAKLRLQEVFDEGGGYGAAPVTRKLDLRRPSGRPQGKIYVDVVIRDGRYAVPPPGVYQPAPYNVREYSGVPVSTPYGYPYTAAPPAPYGAAAYAPPPTPYGAAIPAPPTPYGVAASPPPPYGAAPPYTGASPGGYPYGAAPPPQYGVASGYGPVEEEKKTSKFGGMGTGLAVGAMAGALGGLALAEGFDQLEDHIADEAAEKVEDDLAAGGDDDEDDDDDNDDDDW